MVSREESYEGNVRVITCLDKRDCEHLVGCFLDDSHYNILIDEDCDFYAPPIQFGGENSEDNIVFKLRKNVFTNEEQMGAYEGLIKAAGESQNRGMAAGPKGTKLQNRDWVTNYQVKVLEALAEPVMRLDGLDEVDEIIKEHLKNPEKGESTRGIVWLRSKIMAEGYTYETFFSTWLENTLKLSETERAKEAKRIQNNFISGTSYANPVLSGIAGYFDRYPRIPYARPAAYTEKNPELFKKSFPYFKKLDEFFKSLLPNRWGNQRSAADKLDQRFLVNGTVFTSLTINKNFRTAAHRDAGDLSEGFSNLGVVTNGKDYKGGYLVLPEYGVAINIRPGDVLLIANHDGIHGNTPIEGDDDMERMSIVAYFREKMLEAGDFDYEALRRKFVDERRTNKHHPEWRKLWNGVSPSMWSSQEWYDWLAKQPRGQEFLEAYHPESQEEEAVTLF